MTRFFQHILLLIALCVSSGLSAQCPGPAQRTALINLQRANVAEASRAGQIPLTDTCGNQRYAQYVEINLDTINYTPTQTGNLNNLSEFVVTLTGDLWYIDWQGNAVQFQAGSGSCDEDWLEITTNTCPDNILDSIYTQRYAAIGARLVWPTAELLVSDSTGVGLTVISGNRNARLGLYDNFNGVYSTIDQSGTSTIWYIDPTGEMRWTTAGGGTVQSPGAPFVNQFAIDPNDTPLPTLQAYLYPNTRTDTATVRNFLYTDPVGKIRSQAIDTLVQIVVDSIQADTTLQRNWYTHNGVTTDLGRTAFVKRTAWWRGLDSVGFFRFTMRPDLFNGSEMTIFQDSFVLDYEDLSQTRSVIKLYQPGIVIEALGDDPRSIHINTDSIWFYSEKYRWADATPSPLTGDTSFHFWAGNAVNTTPGFMTLDEIRGPNFGENIYNTDDLLKQGGTTVGLDSGSLKLNIPNDAATRYGLQILGHTDNTANRFLQFRTESDSMWIQESSSGYTMQTFLRDLNITSSEQLSFLADSAQFVEGTVETQSVIRFVLGMTPTGWVKRFDGDAGDMIISNGTDWILQNGNEAGYILQNGNSFGTAMTIGTNDNFPLNMEVNGTTGLTMGTDYALTATASVANTNTVADRLVIQTNSTGTAGAGFGGGILFRGESSTTDNRDMAYIYPFWQVATDGTRRSNISFGTVQSGVFSEGFRLNQNVIQNANGLSLVVGGTSNALILGNSTGTVDLASTGTGSTGQIRFSASGNNINTSGTLGNAAFSTTSGTKYDWRMTSGFSPTSGTGLFYNLYFNPAINQTGGANGNTGAIIFAPTLTAVGASWSALTMATSNTAAKFLNQTGANTTSTHVGAFGFGATTVPTDKVEVTGNLALLTAGNKLKIATGANASIGTSAAMTAGSITINTTAVTANSIIFLTHASVGGTQGILSVGTITAGTSFVINSSSATDTGTVNWWIVN